MFAEVIVGVDGRSGGRDAIAVARLLMSAQGGRLRLAHVHELSPVRGASRDYGPSEEAASLQLLERERERAGVEAELVPLTASSVGRGLHYLAETGAADLLVVGSSERSLVGRVLVGDSTRAALIGAPCAVAVAPLDHAATAAGAIATVGIGYDGSPESASALACARELAARHGAQLRALMVVEPSYAGLLRGVPRGEAAQRALAAAREELAAIAGVEGEVASGLAGEELAAFGERVDLLVVGSRGYGPIRTLMLGSTAAHLAGTARCPLLVLPRGTQADAQPAAAAAGTA